MIKIKQNKNIHIILLKGLYAEYRATYLILLKGLYAEYRTHSKHSAIMR